MAFAPDSTTQLFRYQLRGGFAAAHAFLSRNGPDIDMIPEEVLVEYDPSVSLFAQLEKARQEEEVYKNAPASQKTAMVSLTESQCPGLDVQLLTMCNFLGTPKDYRSVYGKTYPRRAAHQ